MKSLTTLLLLLSFFLSAKAQEINPTKKNSLSVTIGGQNFNYEFNYLKTFYERRKTKLHAGISLMPFSNKHLRNSYFEVNESVSLNVGGTYGIVRHYFEYGLGYTFRFYGSPDIRHMTNLEFAYRHQIESNNTFFKISLIPIFHASDWKSNELQTNKIILIPWAGLTIGKIF